MKLYFDAEERQAVMTLLFGLVAKLNRRDRRHIGALAKKFSPSAAYVWLKPGQRLGLLTLLGQSMRALDNIREQKASAAGNSIFEKAVSALNLKGPSEADTKVITLQDMFHRISAKLCLSK